jgi:hypothetical protein
MNSRAPIPHRFSRRTWAALITAAPLVAQVTSSVPPQGTPAAAAPSSTPEAKMQKAYAEVRGVSERLAQIEVPMDVEPAFSFKV